MPRVLYKILDPATDVEKLNVNFDRISLDLAARSGIYSDEATASFTIPAGETNTIDISINDRLDIFQRSRLPVIPRFDIFLDDELPGSYWPNGTNITEIEATTISFSMWQTVSILDEGAEEKASMVGYVRNLDSVSHTFYMTIDVYYVPGPDQGAANV